MLNKTFPKFRAPEAKKAKRRIFSILPSSPLFFRNATYVAFVQTGTATYLFAIQWYLVEQFFRNRAMLPFYFVGLCGTLWIKRTKKSGRKPNVGKTLPFFVSKNGYIYYPLGL